MPKALLNLSKLLKMRGKTVTSEREIQKELYKEQLSYLIDCFVETFQARTSNPENFLTITEIEKMWSELRGNTSDLYSDLLEEALAHVNEAELIRKKKQST